MQAVVQSVPPRAPLPLRTVTYAVAVRCAGRWRRDSIHMGDERGTALAVARELHRHSGVEAVTVTRETCYLDTGAVTEIVIWHSAILARERPAARASVNPMARLSA